jgi:hypothetical protein
MNFALLNDRECYFLHAWLWQLVTQFFPLGCQTENTFRILQNFNLKCEMPSHTFLSFQSEFFVPALEKTVCLFSPALGASDTQETEILGLFLFNCYI